jgi:transposase InsO family protein
MSKADVVKELHRDARKHFERRQTIQHGIKDTFQIDLADLQSLSKYNKNFKYILVIIDIFSKYAWAIPIKTKATENIVNALQCLFVSGHIPKNIHSDMGREFYSATFKKLMTLHNVNHYSTFSTMKAAICDRFIRTLKTLLWKQMHLRGSYNWKTILDDVVKKYNNTKHSTIKMKPKDVKKKHQ